jgi:hypothetical protein
LNRVKGFSLGVAGVALAGCLAIAALHHDVSIETEVVIDSPPANVWKVLTATADYPLWNPEISRLTGPLCEGCVIEFAEGTGQDAMVFRPVVQAVRPDRELRWKGHVGFPGIFDGEHRFMLEAAGNGTRFIQGEQFTGILAGTLTEGIIQSTQDSMRAMNQALKARTEQLSGRR